VNIIEGIPLIEVPFTTAVLMLGMLGEGFAVLDDAGIRVESTTEGEDAFKQDQVVWKFVERRDSAVVHSQAFVKSNAAMT
jgi:HK97 family phage major capsid protein